MIVFLAVSFVLSSIFDFTSSFYTFNKLSAIKFEGENLIRRKDFGIERELDIFFERAAEMGASFAKKLNPSERARLTSLGVKLEDDIMEIRDKLIYMESSAMDSSDSDANMEEIVQLRNQLQHLKNQYIELVGASSAPIYFGKIDFMPDSLQ